MNRKFGLWMPVFVALAGLSLWFWGLSGSSARAQPPGAPDATIVVNTLKDELKSDGDCSLREAILSANTDNAVGGCLAGEGPDTIILLAGIYSLTIPSGGSDEDFAVNGDLDISDRLTILGGNSIISSLVHSRIFEIVTPSTYVTLTHLTIRHGYGETDGAYYYPIGGGILNWGALTIQGSTIFDNFSGVDGEGGGIYSTGMLTITNSTVAENYAESGVGAIFSSGKTTIINSQIIHNDAAFVGGISLGNDLDSTIVGSLISGNWGDFCGVGINTAGRLTIRDSIISDNAGGPGCNYNSGIVNDGDLWIDHSVISSNGEASDGRGGGIYNTHHLTITHSTIDQNEAETGGGIFQLGGTLAITNTTLSGNTALSDGGGIFLLGGTAHLQNVTIAGNVASNDYASYHLAGDGGGIGRAGGQVEVQNSLIAGNFDFSTASQRPDCSSAPGGIASAGYNLVGKVDGCQWVSGPGDITGTIALPAEPLLGPLQNNGGNTSTHALLPGSPAIDAASPDEFPPTDQRGIPRPVDGDGDRVAASDIGSFEFEPVPVLGVSLEGKTAGVLGVTVTFTASVQPISATLPIRYVWQASGQAVVTHTGGLSDRMDLLWDTPGVQAITVTAANLAATITGTHAITIRDVAISGLHAASDSPTLSGQPTTFTATVSSGTNVLYAWDFGDGQAGAGDVVSHTYAQAGVYTATVTASNTAGSGQASTVVQVVIPEIRIYLPILNQTSTLGHEGYRRRS